MNTCISYICSPFRRYDDRRNNQGSPFQNRAGGGNFQRRDFNQGGGNFRGNYGEIRELFEISTIIFHLRPIAMDRIATEIKLLGNCFVIR